MARTYYTVIPPGRRWGLAAASGLVALALSAGLGNPWSAGPIGRLDADRGLTKAAALLHMAVFLHWSTTPSGMAGYGGSGHTGRYTGALILDLGWPLLLFFGVRMLSAGLAPRRGGFALLFGTWGLAAFIGALVAVAAGVADHLIGGRAHLLGYPGALGSAFPGTTNVITAQAATMTLIGLLLGWLPALAAVLGYAVGRSAGREDREEPDAGDDRGDRERRGYVPESGEETTIVDIGSRPVIVGAAATERETLNLAGLEALRNARYDARYETDPDGRGGDGGLMDPRTSTFFGDGQY